MLPPKPSTPDASVPSFSVVENILVSSGDLTPAFDPGVHDYWVTSLTTLQPTTITVEGSDAAIDGHPVANNAPYTTTISALDDSTAVTIAATNGDGSPTYYTIHTLPEDLPSYTVSNIDNPTPGLIFLTPFGTGYYYLMILDELGRLAYYKSVVNPAFDFKRTTLGNGTPRYTYIMTDGPTVTGNTNPSTVFVLDEHFNFLQTIRLSPTTRHGPYGSDLHDFILLNDDHWIVTAYLDETVTNAPNLSSANVIAAVVQEVLAGDVIFEWDSTSRAELYKQSTMTLGGSSYVDYLHMNSIAIDPSNSNLLISLRHTSEVIELDRKTGQTLWTLGGIGDDFKLASLDKTSYQHFAHFIGTDHILLFDNGNGTTRTKIREYFLDHTNQTATVATTTVGTHYTTAMGSVQLVGDRYFIGWGTRAPSETDVTEVDPMGNIHFELKFQGAARSYRAYKL